MTIVEAVKDLHRYKAGAKIMCGGRDDYEIDGELKDEYKETERVITKHAVNAFSCHDCRYLNNKHCTHPDSVNDRFPNGFSVDGYLVDFLCPLKDDKPSCIGCEHFDGNVCKITDIVDNMPDIVSNIFTVRVRNKELINSLCPRGKDILDTKSPEIKKKSSVMNFIDAVRYCSESGSVCVRLDDSLRVLSEPRIGESLPYVRAFNLETLDRCDSPAGNDIDLYDILSEDWHRLIDCNPIYQLKIALNIIKENHG